MKPTTLRLGRGRLAFLALFFLAPALGGSAAFASVITDSPSLPPNTGSYQAGAATLAYPGIVIASTSLQPDAASTSIVFTGSNEIDSFTATLNGLLSLGGSPLIPFTLSGPESVEEFARTSGTELGTFSAQMLSLDVTGTVGGHSVEVMLDQNLGNSTGKTTVADDGGGMFRIDSFFDVFTEISLDGGPFQGQSNAPTVLTLQSLPEPGTLTLLALGACSGLVLTRRRPRAGK
jgi:hypothetical protein